MRLLIAALLAAGATTAAVAADPPQEKRVIPLESCYATFNDSGCKQLSRDMRQPIGYDLGQIYQMHQSGASNAVLVRGDDIAAAVKATRFAFTTSMPADESVPPDPSSKTVPRPVWLVAYLGSGSSSGAFRVHAAETTALVARLSYSRMKPSPLVSDLRQYFIWVPLGEVTPGMYTLELYDANRKMVMLQRRVPVVDR